MGASLRTQESGEASAPRGAQTPGETTVASSDDFQITSVQPATIKAGDELRITGVGFMQTPEMLVRYGDGFDDKPRRVDGRNLKSRVPNLKATGPVQISVTFDGVNWRTYDKTTITYQFDDDKVRAEAIKRRAETFRRENPQHHAVFSRVSSAASGPSASIAQEDVEREAIILGDAKKFYAHYFGHIQQIINEQAEALAVEASNGDRVQEEQYKEHLMRGHKDPHKIKVKLILTDLAFAQNFSAKYGKKALAMAAWVAWIKGSSIHGLVHSALQVGPWILDWNDGNLCRPRACIYQDALMSMDVLGEETLELPRDKAVLEAICQVCTDWNNGVDYSAHNRNCQHFVDALLQVLPGWKEPTPGGSLDRFLDGLRSGKRDFWTFTDPKTGEPKEFKSHADLDDWCTRREMALLQDNTKTHPLGTAEDNALLKAFDRAMWLRHLCDTSAETYQPCSKRGCYFTDPTQSGSIPVNLAYTN